MDGRVQGFEFLGYVLGFVWGGGGWGFFWGGGWICEYVSMRKRGLGGEGRGRWGYKGIGNRGDFLPSCLLFVWQNNREKKEFLEMNKGESQGQKGGI